MSYLILNTKSVDYHDGVHFVKCYYACENSETLRKNVKEIMLLYFFKSISKATFNGMANLS